MSAHHILVHEGTAGDGILRFHSILLFHFWTYDRKHVGRRHIARGAVVHDLLRFFIIDQQISCGQNTYNYFRTNLSTFDNSFSCSGQSRVPEEKHEAKAFKSIQVVVAA